MSRDVGANDRAKARDAAGSSTCDHELSPSDAPCNPHGDGDRWIPSACVSVGGEGEAEVAEGKTQDAAPSDTNGGHQAKAYTTAEAVQVRTVEEGQQQVARESPWYTPGRAGEQVEIAAAPAALTREPLRAEGQDALGPARARQGWRADAQLSAQTAWHLLDEEGVRGRDLAGALAAREIAARGFVRAGEDADLVLAELDTAIALAKADRDARVRRAAAAAAAAACQFKHAQSAPVEEFEGFVAQLLGLNVEVCVCLRVCLRVCL